MKEKRRAWVTGQEKTDPANLVFLDESSVNTDMVRRYGRAISNNRAVDHAPVNTPSATTILSSIRLNGNRAYTYYQGGTTGDRFVDYLKRILLPTLKIGDIVIMDNMRSHHVQEVASTFEGTGIHFCYLPPYSPDLNPIEMLWSKIKSALRSWRVRSSDALQTAIDRAFLAVSSSDCANWFISDNYCSVH